jgi:hypothetical protein
VLSQSADWDNFSLEVDLRKTPDSGYHVVGLRRGEWPNQWIWEIFRQGKPLRERMWGGYFKSYNAAIRAGVPALEKLRTFGAKDDPGAP